MENVSSLINIKSVMGSMIIIVPITFNIYNFEIPCKKEYAYRQFLNTFDVTFLYKKYCSPHLAWE